ncbi:hypothetical protein [Bacillus sp. FJAT-49736]|uniref:hypothetical protein n=1 Tax=Bacillus sp. FJAT-49736 TaxID=2833582 RepID=UPI001BC91D56|nr:hypothetical protein [Bacillus sp. FJAT-49736]MBS4171930.1 hypothetical protein [Bacillus sp. FJAT-49736]
MIIAFQIILLIVLVISFIGVIGEKEKNLRGHLTAVCIASIIAELISFFIFK